MRCDGWMGGRCAPFSLSSYFECEQENTGKGAVIIPGQILCICVDSRYTYPLVFLSVYWFFLKGLAMHSPCRLSIACFEGPGVLSDALCTACCATLQVCVMVVFLCYDSSPFVSRRNHHRFPSTHCTSCISMALFLDANVYELYRLGSLDHCFCVLDHGLDCMRIFNRGEPGAYRNARFHELFRGYNTRGNQLVTAAPRNASPLITTAIYLLLVNQHTSPVDDCPASRTPSPLSRSF